MRCFLLFMAILPYLSIAQTKYSIQGDIKGLKNHHTIYLLSDYKRDSTVINNGKFEFIGTFDRPSLVTIGVYDTANSNLAGPPMLLSFRQFYLSTSDIKISGDSLGTSLIQADYLNSIYSKYWLESDSFRTVGIQRNKIFFDKISKGILTDDEANRHQEEFQRFIKKYQDFDLNFLENNDLTVFSVDLIDRYLNQYNVLKLKKLYERIPINAIDPLQRQSIDSKIIQFSKLTVGAKAPNFTLRDTSGNEISLEQLRGKAILLEFWASWCIPCRKENPVYLEIYDEFKDKGFEIVAISLNRENEKAQWLKAIQDDKTTNWIHLSDLKGYESPIYKLYEIGGLPHSYLLDANGVIMGHNLKGQDLENQLKLLIK